MDTHDIDRLLQRWITNQLHMVYQWSDEQIHPLKMKIKTYERTLALSLILQFLMMIWLLILVILEIKKNYPYE
jgi:hypothetical protein